MQSASSSSAADTTNKSREDDLVIAKAENTAVFRIRLAVIGFLLVCTIGVAVLVYCNTEQGEEEEFESKFLDFSTKILDSFGSSLALSLAATDAFVVSTVSYARAANMTWPFVTVPDFSTRAAKLRADTKTAVILELPVVSDADRDRWDLFSLQNGPSWVDENLRVQQRDPTFFGNKIEAYDTLPIHNSTGVPVGLTEYFPMWQAYPTASSYFSPFNFDVSIYEPLSGVLDVLRGRTAAVGRASNYPGEPLADLLNTFIKDNVGDQGFDTTEPVSELFYPMFNDAARAVSFADGDIPTADSKMVGVVFMPFFWRDFITDTLPPGIDGLDVVIENPCNQTFTYRINGQVPDFQGYGDKHDSKYDEYVQQSKLAALKASSSGRIYTGVPLSDDSCPYTIRIYPSKVFEDSYRSSNPWIYTTLAVSIFVFTSIVFFCYDHLVER